MKRTKIVPSGLYCEAGAGRTRCLGPNEPDHWFVNDGTPGHRVCRWCRGEQDRLNLSVLAVQPVEVGGGVKPPPD